MTNEHETEPGSLESEKVVEDPATEDNVIVVPNPEEIQIREAEEEPNCETQPEGVSGEPTFAAIEEASKQQYDNAVAEESDDEGRPIIQTPEQIRDAQKFQELLESAGASDNKLMSKAVLNQSLVIGNKANKVLGKLIQNLLSQLPLTILVLLADGKVSSDELNQITKLLSKVVLDTLKEEYQVPA